MPSSLGYHAGPLVIPQTAEVRLLWQLANAKPASNVLHAIVPDGLDWVQSDVDDVFNGIISSGGWAELAGLMPTDTRLLGVEIKDLRAANRAGILSSAPAADGVNGQPAFPPGVALVVSLKTAQAGRSFRGRVYIGGWSTDAGDINGNASDSAVSAAQDFMTDVQAALTAKNFELAIGHRGHDAYTSPFTGLEVPAELPGSVPVTQIVVRDAIFDSQRRRK